ncbi:MAG: hypothetical protein ACP5P2_01220 [Candidatus Micrarchaeia archaeon]|jgi:uncharacterized membrane protein
MEEKRTKKEVLVLVLVMSTFLGGLGQFMFKLGLNSQSSILMAILLTLGIISYLLSTVFYFFALSRAHLSWVYSFGGLSYIFASLLAMLIEPVPLLRWLGILVIAIGTSLIGIS